MTRIILKIAYRKKQSNINLGQTLYNVGPTGAGAIVLFADQATYHDVSMTRGIKVPRQHMEPASSLLLNSNDLIRILNQRFL